MFEQPMLALSREVIVTNADKVHAINQLVGDHEMPTCWGFGKRRIKGAYHSCNCFQSDSMPEPNINHIKALRDCRQSNHRNIL